MTYDPSKKKDPLSSMIDFGIDCHPLFASTHEYGVSDDSEDGDFLTVNDSEVEFTFAPDKKHKHCRYLIYKFTTQIRRLSSNKIRPLRIGLIPAIDGCNVSINKEFGVAYDIKHMPQIINLLTKLTP